MKHLPLAAFAIGLCLASPLAAQDAARQNTTTSPLHVTPGTYRSDPGHTRVTWSVSHMGFSTYSGILPAITGTLVLDGKDPTASRVDMTIPMAKVGTLDHELDAHLKTPDFFDVARFPEATFKSTRIEAMGRKAKVTGDLTLHGITKPVTLDVTFNQAGIAPVDKAYTLGFDATARLKRSDFGITTYLPALGDEVKLHIEAEFKAQ